MVKAKSYRKLREVKSKLVVMSRIDFMIAYNVYHLADAIKLNDEEVSFLLGKRNKYFFDLLDTTQKTKFKTEQLDILPAILETSIQNIVPNEIVADDIKFQASKTVYAHKIEYKFITIDGTSPAKGEFTNTLNKSGKPRKLHEAVHKSILRLIDEGYFKEPKTALQIYHHLKKHATLKFRPAELQKSLSMLLSGKARVRLLTKHIRDARYVYCSAE